MTMQIMATGLVGSQKTTVTVNGVEQNLYSVVHPGLTGNPIVIQSIVSPGSAEDIRLEQYRQCTEKAKKGEGSPVRVRIGGVHATLHVKSEYLPNGKVNSKSNQLVPGTVHKVPGIDCIVTSVRQTTMDTTLEPEEFSATVIGVIEASKYKGQKLKDIDLMQRPLQDGMETGFHLRMSADDKQSDAGQVLFDEAAESGAYFLSGYLVRDLNEESSAGSDGKPIAPWDRVALKVVQAYRIEEQNMGKAKARGEAAAQQAAADPNRYNEAMASENATSGSVPDIDESTSLLL